MNNTTIGIMFEMASQFKFRYPYDVGLITTEDLWDLSLTQLDTVYKALSKEMHILQDGDSLLYTRSPDFFNKEQELTAKIELVKYIFKCQQQAEELHHRMEAEKSALKNIPDELG